MYLSSVSSFIPRHITFLFFFFFNNPATPEISPLPLPAALPIPARRDRGRLHPRQHRRHLRQARSEEHTSELQSQSNLVCRLLLEKKKKKTREYNENK